MSQYVDGLVGAMIIKNPSAPSPLPYDEEIVIPLSDWYHTDSVDLLSHYLSRASKGEEVCTNKSNSISICSCKSYIILLCISLHPTMR
jgi:FtsP/CotA-like multicopper oxidase with cupredoxin domain